MKQYVLPEVPYDYAVWKIVNWDDVARRDESVRSLDLLL